MHAHQKRIVADAMYAFRCGRPVADEGGEPPSEDQLDQLLVASVRLTSSVTSYISSHVAGEAAVASPEVPSPPLASCYGLT